MSRATLKAIQAAAGNAGESLYVEDVFSTYLYTGNATSTQTITNGIDLDGEGGLVWIKNRDAVTSHILIDSEAQVLLNSNNTNYGSTGYWPTYFNFNSDGFTTTNTVGDSKTSGNDFASWTFRKAEKFFDVVTYTGDGVAGREIAHNLGSVPACIIIKCTSHADRWYVHHSSVALPDGLFLDTDWAAEDQLTRMVTAPTSTVFTVETDAMVNFSGRTYVAYLFASDAGGFGDNGEESIIKCGSYVGNGTYTQFQDLGFEPQWILFKNASAADDWWVYDSMRGLVVGGPDNRLAPNLSSAEAVTGSSAMTIAATGFTPNAYSTSGQTYIYIAIRRPMKTPESGTEVFNDTFQYGEDGKTAGYLGSPADLDIRIDRTGGGSLVRDRLRGDLYLRTQATDAEAGSQSATWDNMTGYFYYSPGTSANTNIIHYVFKRAPGFFDVVAYTGTGSNAVVKHGLSVIPEVIITKRRDAARNWAYYTNLGASTYTAAVLNDTYAPGATPASYDTGLTAQPSSTDFYVGTSYDCNASTGTYVAYLFATLAGVSKVGSYTGTGADLNVDCGFSAGARFIMIKRTDSTGDWYVWDSVRGIVAGNDPYLLLNDTAAEVTSTDYIDPLASGFTVTSSAPAALNASGGTYIFYAIA